MQGRNASSFDNAGPVKRDDEEASRQQFHLASTLNARAHPGSAWPPTSQPTPANAPAIQVDAIALTVTIVSRFSRWRTEQVLLDDVSLTLAPGAFVAIIGASGAGKTTLLRALSGQVRARSGGVFYNGVALAEHRQEFSSRIGYVPQDDIVHKNLSVEEALLYAAQLRLQRGIPRRELDMRVDQVLQHVGLIEVRHQRIAHLSGGQRKRINIALELLDRPALFFLDEPTSGLDPGLDLRMMQLLRQLADGGQTVALVTHETTNLDLCDEICFLAPGGRLAYFGPPASLKQFFQTEDYASMYNLLHERPDRWIARFRRSPDWQRYVDEPRMRPVASTAVGTSAGMRETDDSLWLNAASWSRGLQQFWVLTRRYISVMAHDLPTLLLLLLQAPIIALLIWLLADTDVLHNVASGLRPTGPPDDIYAQRVLFVVIASAIWFGIINAAREIVKEAPIYQREHAANLGMLPYVFSKVAVLGAFLALQDFVLLIIVGIRTSFPADGLILPDVSGAFIELLVSLLLVSFVGLALGLLVSALVPNTDRAVSIVPVLLIPQIIFANVIFVLDDDIGRTISLVMPSRWGMQVVGTICGLHDHFTDHIVYPFYAADALHVVGFWFALVVLAVVTLGCTVLAMRAREQRA
jgi:ABC-type multidrug transport system ATPase subunit